MPRFDIKWVNSQTKFVVEDKKKMIAALSKQRSFI